MSQATTPTNGRRTDRFAKEEAIIDSFRRKLREAWVDQAVGEMNVRLLFNKGGVRQTRVGMKIEYEFVDERPS